MTPCRQPSARNREIAIAVASGESQASVARRYGVSRQRISQIVGAMRRAPGQSRFPPMRHAAIPPERAPLLRLLRSDEA